MWTAKAMTQFVADEIEKIADARHEGMMRYARRRNHRSRSPVRFHARRNPQYDDDRLTVAKIDPVFIFHQVNHELGRVRALAEVAQWVRIENPVEDLAGEDYVAVRLLQPISGLTGNWIEEQSCTSFYPAGRPADPIATRQPQCCRLPLVLRIEQRRSACRRALANGYAGTPRFRSQSLQKLSQVRVATRCVSPGGLSEAGIFLYLK